MSETIATEFPAGWEISRLAYNAVVDAGMLEECMTSYPVPVKTDQGLGYGFFFCRCETRQGLFANRVLEPEMSVVVNVNTKEPGPIRELAELHQPTALRCVGLEPSESSSRVSKDHYEALSFELWKAGDTVAQLYAGQSSLEPASIELLKRYSELFRFLIDAELHEFYRGLNPAFFEWLENQTGILLSQSIATALRPAFYTNFPKAVLPEPYETRLLNDLMEITPHTRLSRADIQAALKHYGFAPNAYSPLAELGDDDSDFSITDIYGPSDWPWETIWKILSKPSGEIMMLIGEAAYVAVSHLYYQKPGGDQVKWVRFDSPNLLDEKKSDDEFSVAFPIDPVYMRDSMLGHLQANTIPQAENLVHSLKASELFLAAAFADFAGEHPAEKISLDRDALLSRMKTSVEDARWSGLLRLLSPAPLPLAEPALQQGLFALLEQGFIQQREDQFEPTARLRYIIREMTPPQAFGAIHCNYLEEATTVSEGFMVVRTDEALWIIETSTEQPEGGETEFSLFKVNGFQLRAIIQRYLETGIVES